MSVRENSNKNYCELDENWGTVTIFFKITSVLWKLFFEND